MAMGGRVSRRSILHSKEWAQQQRLVLVQECEGTQLECGKQQHLTLPVDRRVTSILVLVGCLQEQWEQELHSSLPTTKLAAPPSMEMQLELPNMAVQAVSSSRM
jgi:hypothetical protein